MPVIMVIASPKGVAIWFRLAEPVRDRHGAARLAMTRVAARLAMT
ncbi:MAG: hypothetical protein U5K38_15875 [Woeseiaceae bacterium]|nr:hypothetical protein [Woeseiaceae bacterium]